MESTRFDISGMSCAACAAGIERAVKKLPGVAKAEVNLLAGSMLAEYGEGLSAADIVRAVEGAGYGASPRPPAGAARAATAAAAPGPNPMEKDLADMKRRLVLSLLFLLPLLYLSMGGMLGLPIPGFLAGAENALSFALSQFLLSLPIALVNHKYFTGGFRALWHKAPNMDSLISLGASASLAYGVFALYRLGWGLGHGDMAVVHHYLHELYFESAATILALITLGKTLEAASKGRTGKAISALLDLAPKTALLLRGGAETEVPLAEVKPGDLLAVKPGAAVPVDGVVETGQGVVDESALTGESIPVDKAAGDAVTGATLNTSGYFTMRAARVGDDTTLAQIVALVQEAGASQAPIARLADKVSGVFVPVVTGIALLCFAVWALAGAGFEFAMARAVTVLVISCPCALGLATPVAIMVGTGRGAKNGILFRSAEALETLAGVRAVVLDKTGTITEGKPRLAGLLPFGMGEDELLARAAALEAKSEHPVALAILEGAAEKGLALPEAADFESLPGLGLRACIEGEVWLAGNARLMRGEGVELSAAAKAAEALAAEGKTPLYFAKNGRLSGLLAVADRQRPGSAAAVAALRRRGLRVVMLTGDTAATARAVAAAVGIGESVAELLPGGKEAEVRRLEESGVRTAMVGDGINDAPALARAGVGVAIGAGTDIAIESAGVVLMKSDLADMVTAYDLSRRTLRTIRQNLFWAFFYNVIGIPIAAGLFYPAFGLVLSPMLGAAAMSLSSLFVVGNALRLNLFKPKTITAIANTEIKEAASMEKSIQIEGMSCGHCAARVEKALNALPGVSATVSLEEKRATLHSDGQVSDQQLRDAVTEAGYEATEIR